MKMFQGYIFLKPVSCNDTTRLQTQKSERKSTRRFCRIMPILFSYAGNVQIGPKDLTPTQRHSKALSKATRSACCQSQLLLPNLRTSVAKPIVSKANNLCYSCPLREINQNKKAPTLLADALCFSNSVIITRSYGCLYV